jgi:hypothetical protein
MPYENANGTLCWLPEEWREREEWRQTHGRVLPVWEKLRWWQERPLDLQRHYVHVSRRNPSMLAYTASEEKGRHDLHTMIRPGRYLQRYCRNLLGPNEINRMASWQMGVGALPDLFQRAELRFVSSPDDIAEIYRHGPHSCMHGFPLRNHPCRVYGAGDLAIAHLVLPDQEWSGHGPRISARSVCWPERKLFGSIYPVQHNWGPDGFASSEESVAAQNELWGRFRALGWEEEEGVGGHPKRSFRGARLLADWQDGEPRMPFIDGDWCAQESKDERYLVLCDSYPGAWAGGTGGWGHQITEDDF